MFAWWALLGDQAGIFDSSSLAIILVLIGVVPVPEVLHALSNPQHGRGPSSIIGIWPAKMLIYAHYLDSMTRERFLTVLMAPLLVLSVLPLPVCLLLRFAPGWVVVMSVWNGLLSCGDLLGFAIVAFQIPRGANIRNQGLATLWKHAD